MLAVLTVTGMVAAHPGTQTRAREEQADRNGTRARLLHQLTLNKHEHTEFKGTASDVPFVEGPQPCQ